MKLCSQALTGYERMASAHVLPDGFMARSISSFSWNGAWQLCTLVYSLSPVNVEVVNFHAFVVFPPLIERTAD